MTDLQVIEDFLHRIGKRQRHHLAAIHPDRPGLFGSTYELKQLPNMLKYIEAQQKRGYGIYYSLNEGVEVFAQRGFNGKLLADEIIKIHMLGFDIDWIAGNQVEREEFQKRALDLIYEQPNGIKPDVMVSSGGGLQALFTLGAAVPVALHRAKMLVKEQEIDNAVSRQFRDDFSILYKDTVIELERLLSPLIKQGVAKVDQLGNIDRVFRLPGTINFPTQAKIAKGATVRPAVIVYDEGTTTDFLLLREEVPSVTPKLERKEKKPFSERPDKKWTVYNKAVFLCEFIKDHRLVEDNEAYTHSLMFPLFGMINRNEITEAQGRELWLSATSTARDPAHGSWKKKWDTRKIANYTGRDIGSIVHFARQHDCLLPWSVVDEEKAVAKEVTQLGLESLRNPQVADENELFNFGNSSLGKQ